MRPYNINQKCCAHNGGYFSALTPVIIYIQLDLVVEYIDDQCLQLFFLISYFHYLQVVLFVLATKLNLISFTLILVTTCQSLFGCSRRLDIVNI